MHFHVDSILAQLRLVEAQRRHRGASASLASRVEALKGFQQRRFMLTYADLLQSARYAPAARFFLEELYGPRDFSQRDAQFARVVPALVRLFPQAIVDVVGTLARLHAVSEALDTHMAMQLSAVQLDAASYVTAWQSTGQAEQRELQVALTLEIGASLDRLVQQPLLRHSLRLMRGPARAAGLADLQSFLEAGFETFRAMQGAVQFLAWVAEREQALVAALFSARLDEAASRHAVLGLLPS